MKERHRLSPNVRTTPEPDASVDSATIELLAVWRREDASSDPVQIREAEEEVAEFKRAMNENRANAGEPILYP